VTQRLLGPFHNRLLLIDGLRLPSGGLAPGHVDGETAGSLLVAGWTYYDGPADARAGWVVPDTDENLTPRPLHRGMDR
jgi:hypothetical protein